MNKIKRIFSLIIFGFALGACFLTACTPPADKVSANYYGAKEINLFLDKEDGQTSEFFNIELKGLSSEMSKDLIFNFDSQKVVDITKVTGEGSRDRYKVEAKVGGTSNVNIVHKDTNKKVAEFFVNVVSKVKQIVAIENANPFVVLNETTAINLARFVKTEPVYATQRNFGMQLVNNEQGVTLTEDGKITVSQMPASGMVDVRVYSLDNSEATPCVISFKVVERPNIQNLTVKNEHDGTLYIENGVVTNNIVLVKNYNNSISLNPIYKGDVNVNIVPSIDNAQIVNLSTKNAEHIISAGKLGQTYLQYKVSVVGYEEIYSVVSIPVSVIDVAKNVYVNNISGDQQLDVYTSYKDSVGLKLKLAVDIVSPVTGGKKELKLQVEGNKNLFSFYYAEGNEPIDIENTLFDNNSTIYVVANEQEIVPNQVNSAVIKVISTKAQEIGVDVSSSLNMVAYIGATSIDVDFAKDGSREENDKTIYALYGTETVVNYKLNENAYVQNVKVSTSVDNIASFSVNKQTKEINIVGLNVGKTYIKLTTDNGTQSELFEVVVFKPLNELETWNVVADNQNSNVYITQAIYEAGNLAQISLIKGYGTNLNVVIPSNATIFDKKITTDSQNEIYVEGSLNRGYISAVQEIEGAKVWVEITTLQPVTNANGQPNGNALKVVSEQKEIIVNSFISVAGLKVYNTKTNKEVSQGVSIYSLDSKLDYYQYLDGVYFADLELRTYPNIVNYQKIEWNISANEFIKIEKVYEQDEQGLYTKNINTGEYVLIELVNNAGEYSGKYSVVDNKIRVIAKNYENNTDFTKATVFAQIYQYGKVTTTQFNVFAISETPVTQINVDKEDVYIDINGESTTQTVKIKINQDATNKNLVAELNYSSDAEYVNFELSEDSSLLTITGLKAKNLVVINIKPNSSRNYENGYWDWSKFKEINIHIADGKTKETAYFIDSEAGLIKALDAQSQSDSEYAYYLLSNNIVLTRNISMYSNFNGYLGTKDDEVYKIENITLNNQAFFNNINENSVIENIEFYFNDRTIDVNNDVNIANIALNVNENAKINNIAVYCNKLTLTVTNAINNLNVAGIAVVVDSGAMITNVKYFGDIEINAQNKAVESLNVGLIASNLHSNAIISGNNDNFSDINLQNAEVVGKIEINNISVTNSAIGGIVGNSQGDVKNIYANVNIYASDCNNVGGVVGYAEDCQIIDVLTSGIVNANNNVGGVVGYANNVNIQESIVEIIYSNNVEINTENVFDYILGNENVGGIAGNINGTIANSYVRAYENYLFIVGQNNVGGIAGTATNLTVNVAYADVNVKALNSANQIAGIVASVNSGATIQNVFFKGTLQGGNVSAFSGNENITVKTSYAIYNQNNYVLYNAQAELVTDLSQIDTGSDFTLIETFRDAGFNITNIQEDLNDINWYIGSDKNNGNPITIVNGVIADKSVSQEQFENALSNLDNLVIANGVIKTGTLSNGEKYIVLNTNSNGYKLSDLFNLNGIALNYEILSGTSATIENQATTLKVKEEGVIDLKISAKLNTKCSAVVHIAFVNSFNSLTIEDVYVDVNKSENINALLKLDDQNVESNIIKLAYSGINDVNFTISNIITDVTFGSIIYSVVNTYSSTVTGKVVSQNTLTAILVVQIGEEYVVLSDLSTTLSENDYTPLKPVQFNVNVQDKANKFDISSVQIDMSLMDSSKIDAQISNAQANDAIVITLNESNVLNHNKKETINKINIVGNYKTSVDDENVVGYPSADETEQTTSLLNLDVKAIEDSQNKIIKYEFELTVNNKFLDADYIKDFVFEDFVLTLTLYPQSNVDLAKTLTIRMSKQDVLKMTMQYYSNGQTTEKNNQQIYTPNEIATNTIIPGKQGILSINMFPTYSNYDGVYITAVGENGQGVILTQKVLIDYDKTTDDGNKEATKSFVSVKPTTEELNNGIYLRKVSNGSVGTNGINADDLKYDGNLYVLMYIPKTTPRNIKFTIKVTTFRVDENNKIIDSTIIQSPEFYLYSQDVPLIDVNTQQQENSKIVVNGTEYYSLVAGNNVQMDINAQNFNGIISSPIVSVTYPNNSTLDSWYGYNTDTSSSDAMSVLYGLFKKNGLSTECSVSVDQTNNKLKINVPIVVPVGTKITIMLQISKVVNGVQLIDTWEEEFYVIDYRISDFYISTDAESARYDNVMKVYAKQKTNIYFILQCDKPQQDKTDWNVKEDDLDQINTAYQTVIESINGKIDKILETIQRNYEKYFKKFENDIEFASNINNFEFTIKSSNITSYMPTDKQNVFETELKWNYTINAETKSLQINFDIQENDNCNHIIHTDYIVESEDPSKLDSAIEVKTVEQFFNAINTAGHYILTRDLDLSGYYGVETLHSSLVPQFTSFNGNGHTITTNMLTKTLEEGSESIGFFAQIPKDVIVRNLKVVYNLTNIEPESGLSKFQFDLQGLTGVNFGLFAGVNNGVIFNCSVSFKTNTINNNVNIEFINNSDNINLNIGGFVGENSQTGFITASHINENVLNNKQVNNNIIEIPNLIQIKTEFKSNIAGFVCVNNGKMSKNSTENISLISMDDESIVAGFVCENAPSAIITECSVDNVGEMEKTKADNHNEILTNALNRSIATLSSKGVVAGFANLNAGEISNCYSFSKMQTLYRSAGFVYENSGKIVNSHTLSKAVIEKSSDNATNENGTDTQSQTKFAYYESRANTPFTGTNQVNEVNNSGLITNSFYLTTESDLQKYADILYDEPARYVKSINYSLEEFYGFDFNDVNFATWNFNDNYPKLNCQNVRVDNLNAEESEEGTVNIVVGNSNSGKSVNNPYIVHNADSLLKVLTDGRNINNKENYVKVYIQIVADIDMDEVENDSRFIDIQNRAFVGMIDGNNYKINNLSVLVASTSVNKAESFGFFKQIGLTIADKTAIKNANINVKQMESSTAKAVGVLAGESENTQFVNVHLDGEGVVVSGANAVGGLIGYVSGSSVTYLDNVSSNLSVSAGYDSSHDGTYYTYRNVANSGNTDNAKDKSVDISQLSYAGGLVGIYDNVNMFKDQEDNVIRLATVFRSSVDGRLDISADIVGGLFGFFNGKMYDVKFEVIEQTDAQHLNGAYIIGGIVGQNDKKSEISYARVEVEEELIEYYDTDQGENAKVNTLFNDAEKDQSPKYIGGIIGEDNGGNIEYAYSKVNVIHSNASYAGGFAGKITNYTKLKQIFVTGNVYAGSNYKFDGKEYNLDNLTTTNLSSVEATPQNIAGGLAGYMSLINNTTDTDKFNYDEFSFVSVIGVNNFIQPSGINFDSSIELTYKGVTEGVASKAITVAKDKVVNVTIEPNVFAYIGGSSDIGDAKNFATIKNSKGEQEVNFLYKLSNMEISQNSKIKFEDYNLEVSKDSTETTSTIITAVYTDRNLMKLEYEATFNVGKNYDVEKWNDVDLEKSYYPTFALLAPENIIEIRSEEDLKKLYGDSEKKVFILKNDIYLTDYWTPVEMFKGTLQGQEYDQDGKPTGNTFTIYNINIKGESESNSSFGFIRTASGAKIYDINFVFGSKFEYFNSENDKKDLEDTNRITYFANGVGVEMLYTKGVKSIHSGALIGSANNTLLSEVDIKFANQMEINFGYNKNKSENETPKANLNYYGAVVGYATDSTIKTISVTRESIGSNFMKVSNEQSNCFVGGFVGKASNTNMTGVDVDYIGSDNINGEIAVERAFNTDMNVGGFAGQLEGLEVSNCSLANANINIAREGSTQENKENKENKGNIGGFVGESSANFTNCNVIVDLQVTDSVINAGGFAGKMTSGAKNITVKVNAVLNNVYNFGGFVGFVNNNGNVNFELISVDINASKVVGYYNSAINNSEISNIAGFIAYVNDNISVKQCGVNGTIVAESVKKFAGFIATMSGSNSTIENCFTALNMNYENSSSKDSTIAGFVSNCNNASIKNSYSAGKINATNRNNKVAGFVYSQATMKNCFSLVTINSNILDEAFAFAPKTISNNSNTIENCFYIHNLSGVTYGSNQGGKVVSQEFLTQQDLGSSFVKTNNGEAYVYPHIKYDSTTLEEKLFGADILKQGTMLNPLVISNFEQISNLNDNIYINDYLKVNNYYIYFNGNLDVTDINEIKLENSTFFGNGVIVTSENDITISLDKTSYFAGFTLVSTEDVKIYFDQNYGKIFNCFTTGTIFAKNNSMLTGFVNYNEGSILNCGTNVTFNVNEQSASVNGFVKENGGIIANCYAVTELTNVKTQSTNSLASYEYAMQGNYFAGFAGINQLEISTGPNSATYKNGQIEWCYSVFATISEYGVYPFTYDQNGEYENCYYDKLASYHDVDSLGVENIHGTKGVDYLGIKNILTSDSNRVYRGGFIANDVLNYGYPTFEYSGKFNSKLNSDRPEKVTAEKVTEKSNCYYVNSPSLLNYHLKESDKNEINIEITADLNLKGAKNLYIVPFKNDTWKNLTIKGNGHNLFNAVDMLIENAGSLNVENLTIFGEMKNGRLTNAITATSNFGPFGGVANYAKLTNCVSYVNILAEQTSINTNTYFAVGGLIGETSGGTIKNCSSFGDIIISKYNRNEQLACGGLVGSFVSTNGSSFNFEGTNTVYSSIICKNTQQKFNEKKINVAINYDDSSENINGKIIVKDNAQILYNSDLVLKPTSTTVYSDISGSEKAINVNAFRYECFDNNRTDANIKANMSKYINQEQGTKFNPIIIPNLANGNFTITSGTSEYQYKYYSATANSTVNQAESDYHIKNLFIIGNTKNTVVSLAGTGNHTNLMLSNLTISSYATGFVGGLVNSVLSQIISSVDGTYLYNSITDCYINDITLKGTARAMANTATRSAFINVRESGSTVEYDDEGRPIIHTTTPLIAQTGYGLQIIGCTKYSDLHSNSYYIGGIVGDLKNYYEYYEGMNIYFNSNIENCSMNGSVLVTTSNVGFNNRYVGGIVGHIVGYIMNNSTIDGCYVNKKISTQSGLALELGLHIGGIAGYAENTTIEGCIMRSELSVNCLAILKKPSPYEIVSSTVNIGGIVGYLKSGNIRDVETRESISVGVYANLSNTSPDKVIVNMGGFVGFAGDSTINSSSYNYCPSSVVYQTYDSNNIYYIPYSKDKLYVNAGGIAGSIHSTTVNNSKWSGGVVKVVYNASYTEADIYCSAIGDVDMINNNDNFREHNSIGGAVGYAQYNSKISNCTVQGKLQSLISKIGGIVGTVVGEYGANSLINCTSTIAPEDMIFGRNANRSEPGVITGTLEDHAQDWFADTGLIVGYLTGGTLFVENIKYGVNEAGRNFNSSIDPLKDPSAYVNEDPNLKAYRYCFNIYRGIKLRWNNGTFDYSVIKIIGKINGTTLQSTNGSSIIEQLHPEFGYQTTLTYGNYAINPFMSDNKNYVFATMIDGDTRVRSEWELVEACNRRFLASNLYTQWMNNY